jgi:hypothetical protein
LLSLANSWDLGVRTSFWCVPSWPEHQKWRLANSGASQFASGFSDTFPARSNVQKTGWKFRASSQTPTEGAHVMALIEIYRRTLETSDIETRLAAIEGTLPQPRFR